QDACKRYGKDLRVHFKSLKCGSLARYLATQGVSAFLCAKLNEAEVLADAGLTDIFVANQIVGPLKLARLARPPKRGRMRVCVDDDANIAEMGSAVRAEGATLEVLVEVNVGMNRCGVAPGEEALALARRIGAEPGLRFVGLQGYDGHLQMQPNAEEKRS